MVVSDDVNSPSSDGQFISLWELFAQIGKAERALDYEAAGYLISCLDRDPAGINYLRHRDESGLVLPIDMGARMRLVQQLEIFSSQGTLLDDDGRPNDDAQPAFERAGFYLSDIYPFLARHDVAVSGLAEESAEGHAFPNGRRIPGWMLAYADRTSISLSRAAKLLLAATDAAELPSPRYEEELTQWENALFDAIDRGEIAAKEMNRRSMLAHADIYAWSQRHGYAWPFIASKVAQAMDTNAALSLNLQADGTADEHRDATPKAIKHELETRSNPLRAVIDQARSQAVDKNDSHSVWAALVKMAQSKNSPPPLLEYKDGAGILWDKDNATAVFTKKAFLGRWARAKGGDK